MMHPGPGGLPAMHRYLIERQQDEFDRMDFPCCEHCGHSFDDPPSHPIRCGYCIAELCEVYGPPEEFVDIGFGPVRVSGYSVRVLMELWLEQIDKAGLEQR